MFRTSVQGKGFATEAAQAARDYAFGPLGLPTLVSTIDHNNDPSIRLSERLGATRDAAAEAAHDNAIRVYRHPGPEVRQ
jgi:RimJ/RimL family protein N-acetyltransferase